MDSHLGLAVRNLIFYFFFFPPPGFFLFFCLALENLHVEILMTRRALLIQFSAAQIFLAEAADSDCVQTFGRAAVPEQRRATDLSQQPALRTRMRNKSTLDTIFKLLTNSKLMLKINKAPLNESGV